MLSFPFSYDMGTKNLERLVELLTGRVTALENRPAVLSTESKRDFYMALTALVFAVVIVPLTMVVWLEPHLSADLRNDAKIEVADQLKEPLKQLNEISGDVREIKGKLEILAPEINDLLQKTMRVANASQLSSLVLAARDGKVSIDPKVIQSVGDRVIDNSRDAQQWNAVLSLMSYKSFVNGVLLPQSVPKTKAQSTLYHLPSIPGTTAPQLAVTGWVKKEAAARLDYIGQDQNKGDFGDQLAFVVGGLQNIDNLEMKNVVFIRVQVRYTGKPLIMTNVQFIDCTFDIKRDAPEVKFAKAVISPSPVIAELRLAQSEVSATRQSTIVARLEKGQ